MSGAAQKSIITLSDPINRRSNKGINRTRNQTVFHLLGSQRAGYPQRWAASLNEKECVTSLQLALIQNLHQPCITICEMSAT
jgi:hypothetical protein